MQRLRFSPITRSAYTIADQISVIKFAGIRLVCPFPRFSTLIAANGQQIQPIRLGDFITRLFKMTDSSGTWSLGTRLKCHIAAIGEKIAKCVRNNWWRKSLAIFAADPIRRDRRIKSPSVSSALGYVIPVQLFSILTFYTLQLKSYVSS